MMLALLGLLLAAQDGTLLAGTAHETPYWVQDSGVPGPRVFIVGGIHGNERAGAYAAEQIRHWPIRRGVMIVVPRANVTALDADKRHIPGADEALRDLNRNFPRKDRKPGEVRGKLASALWAFARTQKPDWVLDLHEGFGFGRINKKTVGSSIIADRKPETREVGRLMIEAVDATIREEKKKFMARGPPVDGSLARAASVHLGARAMILETTRQDQRLPFRARQHRIMVHRFLRHLDMIGDGVTPELMTGKGGARKVALYDDAGSTGPGIPRLVDLLRKTEAYTVNRVSPGDIRRGALSQFDIVIFSGGSGSGQAKTIDREGRERVARFVKQGGGYVGICAGAYLACRGFSWGLGILDAKTASPKWKRGRAMVEVELTKEGKAILGDRDGRFPFKYANGPILVPADDDAIPDFTPLATFRSEVAENGAPKGVMVDTPAVVSAPFGRGRVVCFSPHPEQTEGLEQMVLRALEWTSKKR